jgi:hypothetical protein
MWKERNNRIFENSEKSAQQLAASILEETNLQLMIYSTPWQSFMTAVSLCSIGSEHLCPLVATLVICPYSFQALFALLWPVVFWLPCLFWCWGAMLSAIWFVASGGCSLGGGDYGEINVISAHPKPCGAPSGLVVCVCFFVLLTGPVRD